MTRGVPMLEPKRDLAGATPETLVRTLLRNATHREWLKGTKRGGTQRQGSDMRKFDDSEGQYRERWDVLGL